MPLPVALPVLDPALIFAVSGSNLTCETSSAEAADMVWRARSQWLLLWPVDQLILRWTCPETNEAVVLEYERGSSGTAAAPSALPLG
jgi:hypothetical protein